MILRLLLTPPLILGTLWAGCPAARPVPGTTETTSAQVAALRPVTTAVEVHADEPFTAGDYLAAADRLTLRFRGFPELTGDYRISPDRSISIPVIGRVSIAGLDLEGLEKLLSTKLSQIVQKEAFVTSEVAAYRPVYVTGAVRNPGAVEWRPGVTVLQAIALVGGMAAVSPSGAVPGAASPLDALALMKAIEGQKRDLATIARLRAERRDVPDIDLPPALVKLVGRSEANALIGNETEILKNDRESLAARLATLDQGIGAGNTEIESLRKQIDKLNAQMEIRIDYRDKVKELFTKGIITAERNLQEEIKVSDLEEKITNINVGIAKSSGTVAELQLAAVGLKRDRASTIDAELARVERESALLAIEIGAARQVAPTRLQPARDSDDDEPAVSLQIVRRQNGSSVTIAADQGTLMRPGDVLIVGRP